MIIDLPVRPFRLECGVPLPGLHVRAQVLGPEGADLAPWAAEVGPTPQIVQRDPRALSDLWARRAPTLDPEVPTIVLVHALTGDARAGGPGGWWEPLIGPGRPLDPTRTRLLCINNLGSCYGTFGPADPGFPTWSQAPGSPSGALPPPPPWAPAPITTWDQARLLLATFDAFGIERIERIAGGSVGGMIALATQALAPERVRAVDAIATSAAASPWVLGWNQVGRQAIFADPRRGLELARQLAHLSYRAEEGLKERQGRRQRGRGLKADYAMQTYLEHHGRKLAQRFHPAAYVAQIDAMDHHDLDRPISPDPHEGWRAGTPWGVERLHDVRGIGLSTDRLFPPEPLRHLVERLPRSSFHLLDNPHGHDAFLMDWPAMATALSAPHPGASR
ncbi:MAG: alpha/beta fold hydrolase [Deltaproteobacteria bacterium]|nr:MAG: alpha/beta fold hydrolase [Deltaproteobacteria bacterium]